MVNRIGEQLGNYRLIRCWGMGTGLLSIWDSISTCKPRLPSKYSMSNWQIMNCRASSPKHVRLLIDGHPHIVQVLDLASRITAAFLVLDYARNGNLRQFHQKGTRLPLDTVISYVARSPMPYSMPTSNSSFIVTSSQKICSWGQPGGPAQRLWHCHTCPNFRLPTRSGRREPSLIWPQSNYKRVLARPAISTH